MVFWALIVFSCTTASAADQQDMKAEVQAAQPGGTSAAPASAEGEQVTVKCPNCGETVNIGRHGQTSGDTMKCPYCGKEICTKEEAEKGVCSGADMAFMSKYVSRAVTMTNGPVFEPNVWASYKGFTASVWANMDLTDRNHNRGEFTEFDFTLDYSASVGKLGLSAGAIYYDFISAKDTAEVYGGISYDMFLNPKLVVYYDYWQADGFYSVFSIGHCFGLPQPAPWMKPSLALSGQVGWGSKNYNSFNWGAERSTFTDMVLTASLPVAISDHFTVKPTVSYSTVLDRTIRTKNQHNDNVIWGVVSSASF
jgi:ribosomal protein S27E